MISVKFYASNASLVNVYVTNPPVCQILCQLRFSLSKLYVSNTSVRQMVYVSKYSRGILLNFKSILDYLVHISFFFFHLSNISEYNFDDNIEYYGDIENNCVANIKNVKIRSFFPCNSCTHVHHCLGVCIILYFLRLYDASSQSYTIY